ncbi:MAG: DUF1772 domain-containing protein [Paracoccus sp. (in: a-proteobacteria)]
MFFALLSVLFSGAIFGFFYAWTCSTMWGLDAADPAVAIAAMQAMNASVRNAVFAPAFFGTPLVLLVTAVVAWKRARGAGLAFLAAALVYTAGGLILTMAVNVPMNEALAAVAIPADPAEAAAIWADYSPRWQVWNQIRTVASGLALLLSAWGVWRLGAARATSTRPW